MLPCMYTQVLQKKEAEEEEGKEKEYIHEETGSHFPEKKRMGNGDVMMEGISQLPS